MTIRSLFNRNWEQPAAVQLESARPSNSNTMLKTGMAGSSQYRQL